MKKLKAGIIGAGMGRHHITDYRKHPAVDVVALADIKEGLLHEICDKYGVSARYTDPAEMLARESLDILSVATPNKFHREQTILAQVSRFLS